MRKFKKLFSLVLAVTMVFGIFANSLSVQAADIDDYAKELVSYYMNYQDAASTDIERVISEMKLVDEDTATAWEKIMNLWSDANSEGYVNIDTVPEGLPEDDSMAVVILGFALNADGTMKDELVDRLQTGLNIANAYENCYVVVTGGGTAANNKEVTEGGLMGEWLLEQGLDEERLIVENHAPSTVGNAQYTYEILKTEYPEVTSVVLVTSDYHVPRGCLIYYSKFVLDALAKGEEPLEIVSNAGCKTDHEGYETISLQASGLCSVAGMSTSNLPTVELSELETLTVSFASEEAVAVSENDELNLTAVANYDSGYERNVTDFVTIEGFDPEAGSNQTIFVSYEENGLEAKGYFTLSDGEKTFTTYYSKLEKVLEEVSALVEELYTPKTAEIFRFAKEHAEAVLADANATDEDYMSAGEAIAKALSALVARENIAMKKPVTASHNNANAYKITDGSTSTYWEGLESGVNIAVDETSFVIDLQGIYSVDAITAIPYFNGEERYYHYDISVSEDNEIWKKVAEQRSEEDTLASGATFVLENAEEARYVKVEGVATKVFGRDDINNFHVTEMRVYGDLVEEIESVKPVTNLAQYARVNVDGGTNAYKITDNSIAATNSYWESGNAIESSWCIIELPALSEVSEFTVVPYYKNASRYYNYEIFVSEDNTEWTSVAKYEDTTVPLTENGQTFTLDEPVHAKYVKIAGIGSNSTNKMHIVEVKVFGTMDNIAEGKSTTVNKHSGTDGASAVDGSLSSWWSSDTTWASATEADLPCMVLDLGSIYELDNINIMNYYSTSRYYQYRLYTSMDGEEYTLLGQKDNDEPSYWSTNFTPEKETTARFIKFVGTLNSANSGFHLNELRVTGTLVIEEDADYSAVEAAFAKVPEDLSIYTAASVVDLKIALAAVQEGLKESRQAEVDTMAQAIEDAIAALEEKEEIPDPGETPEQKEEVCEIFVDVEHGAWYEGSVQYVYDEEIIIGDGNVFAPDNGTTRAMVAVILYRLAGSPEVTEADYEEYNKFGDLPEEKAWYSDAVAWALKEKVSTGDDYAMLYNPELPVTREQLALFLWRYAQYNKEDVTVDKTEEELFGDTYVNSWAKEGFAWAIDRGIIKGAETTDAAGNIYYELLPQGTATRAQLARMLHRYLGGMTE